MRWGWCAGSGLLLVISLIALLPGAAAETRWRVGVARRDITPVGPIWMGGYASRDHPSEGVLQPLAAKALIVEDRRGSRVAFVCMDLIGVDARLCDEVAQRAFASTGIARERIIFNSSHTHCGPVIAGVTPIVYNLDADQQEAVDAYTEKLKDKLVDLISAAAKDLGPADLLHGEGKATFGANRRAMRGMKNPSPDPAAPCDHAVPVIVARDPDGKLRAVLFGYACHATTTAIFRINGDYPGYAQADIEGAHPGATALFLAGCGGDTNPHPRGEIGMAKLHGRELATAVTAILNSPMQGLDGALDVVSQTVELKLVDAPRKEELQRLLNDKNAYRQRLARHLLAELGAGRGLPSSCRCLIQVVRFGEDAMLVAIPGEPVIDYALRLRREFAGHRLWVAGYCNEIFAYVPSERVLKEGGYEGGEAMMYFGLHGAFRPGLEEQIVGAIKHLARAWMTGRFDSTRANAPVMVMP